MATLLRVIAFPFMKRDEGRYDIRHFQALGLDVRVLDLTWLKYPEARDRPVFMPDVIEPDYLTRVESEAGIRAFLDSLAGPVTALYDDLVWEGHMAPYLSLINGRADRVAVVHVGAPFPQFHRDPARVVTGQTPWRVLKRKLGTLALKLRSHGLSGLKTRPPFVFKPDVVFANCQTEADKAARLFPDVPIEPLHIRDYELYREAAARVGQDRRYCVFLDECINTTHDAQILGISKSRIDLDRYFASLERLFGRIEAETGLEVVVAEHPRAIYEPGAYGGRQRIKNATAELVAQAGLVVTHRSTAASFAVIRRIPVLCVVTAPLADLWSNSRIMEICEAHALADALGTRLVNIDDAAEMAALDLANLTFDKAAYDEYFRRFIALEPSERSRAEIVADRLFGLGCGTAGMEGAA